MLYILLDFEPSLEDCEDYVGHAYVPDNLQANDYGLFHRSTVTNCARKARAVECERQEDYHIRSAA